MLKINLIVVGKLKDKFLIEAEKEYLKRLQPYASIKFYELKEESFNEKDPVEFIKIKEGKKIIEILQELDGFTVALEEKGKQFSSEAFSKELQNWKESFGEINFIIGGPLGLSREVVEKAKRTLSLSPMTFTHQMTRVLLLEQIYRAEMINHGRKYHY